MDHDTRKFVESLRPFLPEFYEKIVESSRSSLSDFYENLLNANKKFTLILIFMLLCGVGFSLFLIWSGVDYNSVTSKQKSSQQFSENLNISAEVPKGSVNLQAQGGGGKGTIMIFIGVVSFFLCCACVVFVLFKNQTALKFQKFQKE